MNALNGIKWSSPSQELREDNTFDNMLSAVSKEHLQFYASQWLQNVWSALRYWWCFFFFPHCNHLGLFNHAALRSGTGNTPVQQATVDRWVKLHVTKWPLTGIDNGIFVEMRISEGKLTISARVNPGVLWFSEPTGTFLDFEGGCSQSSCDLTGKVASCIFNSYKVQQLPGSWKRWAV